MTFIRSRILLSKRLCQQHRFNYRIKPSTADFAGLDHLPNGRLIKRFQLPTQHKTEQTPGQIATKLISSLPHQPAFQFSCSGKLLTTGQNTRGINRLTVLPPAKTTNCIELLQPETEWINAGMTCRTGRTPKRTTGQTLQTIFRITLCSGKVPQLKFARRRAAFRRMRAGDLHPVNRQSTWRLRALLCRASRSTILPARA